MSNMKNIKRFFIIFDSDNELRILKFNIDFFFVEVVEHLLEILYYIIREYIIFKKF